MRAPFEPLGEKPRWQMIYESMAGLDVGDVLTYEAMAEALDEERFHDGHRSAFYKAANRWGEEHQRAFAPVPRVGYRIVDAPEHEVLARNHHRRSKRQIAKSRSMLRTADRSRLDDEQVQRFDAMERTLGRHADMIRRLDARQARHERTVAEVAGEAKSTAGELERLKELLARHGITE